MVGAKSRNLADLRCELPEFVKLPPSMALPFATFEAVLVATTNKVP